MAHLQVSGKDYEVVRFKLRKWLELEDIRIAINKAVETKDIDRFAESVYVYISTALDLDTEELPWYETLEIFSLIKSENVPKLDLPLLKSKLQSEKIAWDYDDRTWYVWSHLLANAYGWDLEYIAELDVDDAIALSQEIMIQDQLAKEWEWNLSQFAYSYNPDTKKSKHHPLPRPDWMGEPAPKLKKVKIKESMMPVGNIIDISGMNEVLQ